MTKAEELAIIEKWRIGDIDELELDPLNSKIEEKLYERFEDVEWGYLSQPNPIHKIYYAGMDYIEISEENFNHLIRMAIDLGNSFDDIADYVVAFILEYYL